MGRKFTDKETRQFLESIQEFAKKNHERLTQIMELRSVAESCTVSTDKESVQSSGSDKMSNIVGRIVDLEREIFETDKIIQHRRAEFNEITDKFPDKRQKEKDFLTIRYYDGNGFYDTVMIMDLSDTTAKRIHQNAIAEFTRLFNEKHYI